MSDNHPILFIVSPPSHRSVSRGSGDAFLALCRAKPTKSGVELEATGKHMFPKFSEYFFKHASYTDQQGRNECKALKFTEPCSTFKNTALFFIPGRSLVIGGDKDGNIFVYMLKPDGSCKFSKVGLGR